MDLWMNCLDTVFKKKKKSIFFFLCFIFFGSRTEGNTEVGLCGYLWSHLYPRMPVLRASGAIESMGFGPRDCDRNVCKLQSCSPTITRPPRNILNGHSPGTLRRLRSPVSFAIISSRSTNSVTVSRQWLSFFCCFFFYVPLAQVGTLSFILQFGS